MRRPLVHRLSAIPSFRRYPSSISVTVAPPSLGFFLPRLGSARSAEGNSVGLVANERDCSIVPAQVPSDDEPELVLGDRQGRQAVVAVVSPHKPDERSVRRRHNGVVPNACPASALVRQN